jgi:hypothetical protein
MPSADSDPPAALAALARAARSLRDAPAAEQGWRLRRLIGDAARLAAIGGADPLSLAQDAWQAASDVSTRTEANGTDPGALQGAAEGAPSGEPVDAPSEPPLDELSARRRRVGRNAADPLGPTARVLPFRQTPR